MKKVLVLFTFCAATVIGCNSADNGAKKEEEKKSGSTTPASDPAADEKALTMIGSLDCVACHKLNEKSTGPAYSEVAKKYEATEANINDLAGKIIKGGKGVWGDLPMTPHPTLSMDSARLMVKYILSLKDKKLQ